jgi:hypothetical protein
MAASNASYREDLWQPSQATSHAAVNELDAHQLQTNHSRAEFVRALKLVKGFQLLDDLQLPMTAANQAAISLIRAHHANIHADTASESQPLAQLDALPLPSELANRLTMMEATGSSQDGSQPLFEHVTAMAFDHLWHFLKLHLGHAFDPWLQSLLDIQDTVAKPIIRPSDATKHTPLLPHTSSATTYRKSSISMLSGIKWRRYKRQASAHSPSTSAPATPLTARAFTSSGEDERIPLRPDVLARVFVHGIERFASASHAQTAVVRCHPGELLSTVLYRYWLTLLTL